MEHNGTHLIFGKEHYIIPNYYGTYILHTFNRVFLPENILKIDIILQKSAAAASEYQVQEDLCYFPLDQTEPREEDLLQLSLKHGTSS